VEGGPGALALVGLELAIKAWASAAMMCSSSKGIRISIVQLCVIQAVCIAAPASRCYSIFFCIDRTVLDANIAQRNAFFAQP
jgi:hypothetical protein